MRIVVMVVALALAGCAKKQKAAQAPAAPPVEKAADSPVESSGAPDTDDKASSEGDPCDGGENKNK